MLCMLIIYVISVSYFNVFTLTIANVRIIFEKIQKKNHNFAKTIKVNQPWEYTSIRATDLCSNVSIQ